MPQITPQDIIRISANPNPLVQRATRALLERLKHALAPHQHITFTKWSVHQKNATNPKIRRTITTVHIAKEYDESPRSIQLIISVKDSGQTYYGMIVDGNKINSTMLPLDRMDAIDPINQPADTHGFVAHVLDTIRTHVTDLPKPNGYFI